MIQKWIQKWIQYIQINQSGYLDPYYYLLTYPDCRRADLDPILHYIQFGWKEGRNPSAKFDTKYYLTINPDVAEAGVNPLLHYLQYGLREGRTALPDQTPLETQKRQNAKQLNSLSSLIYETGRKIYWWSPPKYRREFVQWSYQHIGFLFAGLPDYKNWLNSQSPLKTDFYSQQYLISINQVQPAQHTEGSIAIHIHIFYPDLVREFAGYLKNMPFPYDLFVSIPDNKILSIYERAFTGLPLCGRVDIKPVVNRGRDLAPMFCTFGEDLAQYDYVAHLHGKKSTYNKGATEGWREYLCNNLLGSEERVRRIFSLLQGKRPCGIVYPQNYIFLPYWANTWLANRGLGQIWCARLGISDIPRGYFDYPTSSMFWARGDALTPLFQTGIKLDDFPEESGQTDGTLAHCLERLFVLCTLKQNMLPGIIRDETHPSWSAWRIDQYTNRSFYDIVQILGSPKIKLIAFDIFDTLLCRPLLDPETIKTIVSRRIGGEAGHRYKEYRGIAEHQAREAKGLDVGLDEIYSHLGKLTGLSEQNLLNIRRMEEEIEEASLEPRREALDLYERALATGKAVVFISDMFLPRSLIEKCLDKYGIRNWDRIFLSNEVGLRKDTGNLYKHVLDHYSIEPDQLLMIGDNERSDVQIPCDMGAAFIHLIKPTELSRGLPRFSNIIVQHEHRGNSDAEITLGMVIRKNFTSIHYQTFDPDSLIDVEPYNWGYSLVGPLLISFVQWLYQKAREDGLDRLYFLSREGKIIKQVYDCWTEGDKKAPKSDYLVVSRRAAGVAAISKLDDILDIAKTIYFPNTIEKFLITRYGISLPDKQWEKYEHSLGIGRTTTISVEGRQINRLLPLLQTLEPVIIAKAQNERTTLFRYLNDKGLNLDDRQAVVDIGYGGSVQGYMNKLLSRKVHGYYLMTDERIEKVVNAYAVIIRSCFSGRTKQPSETSTMYGRSFELEKLLGSNESQIEFYDVDSSDNLKGHYRDLLSQEIESATIRNQLQEGVMDFVREAFQIRESMLPDFQPSCWTAQMIMEAFLTQLSKKETDLFSKFVLDDHYCGRDLVT